MVVTEYNLLHFLTSNDKNTKFENDVFSHYIFYSMMSKMRLFIHTNFKLKENYKNNRSAVNGNLTSR